jgi:predicted PurR-regulated permease PerM
LVIYSNQSELKKGIFILQGGRSENNKIMNSMRFITLFLLLVGLSFQVVAQDEETEETGNNLSDQFQDMKNTSNNYQDYEVVKTSKLNTFFRNVQDTINEKDQKLVELSKTIDDQNARLSDLQKQIASQDESIKASDYDTKHINVFGIDMEKGSYITTNLVIILILVIILLFFWYKFKESRKVAVQKKNEYNTLEGDFNDFKQNARDKEIKLKRELQTELNRNEELNQKLSARK